MQLARPGTFAISAPCPWLLADSTDRANVLFLSIHSANKQFFEIGKFLALHDELRHQQMIKITHKIEFCFLYFYELNRSLEN